MFLSPQDYTPLLTNTKIFLFRIMKEVSFFSAYMYLCDTNKHKHLLKVSTYLHKYDGLFHCEVNLRGGMNCNGETEQRKSPLKILTVKLATIGLKPLETGGDGACFFKTCSYQLFGTTDYHQEMGFAGINHMNNHPELYIESFFRWLMTMSKWSCKCMTIEQMSEPETWCGNIIIQAISYSFVLYT